MRLRGTLLGACAGPAVAMAMAMAMPCLAEVAGTLPSPAFQPSARSAPVLSPAQVAESFSGDLVIPAPAFSDTGASGDLTRSYDYASGRGFVGSRTQEAYRRNPSGTVDRVRVTLSGDLRDASGAPLPAAGLDEAALEPDSYDVSYTRAFPGMVAGRTAGGLQVDLTPHAGVGMTSLGGSAEAGATLRIGSGLDHLVPEGEDRFGQRGRWYLYAAGSGRAVGYNWARTRDGGYLRSGMSHDTGSFVGDAQVGVAWRRGDVQTSFGYVHREIKARGLVGEGIDNDQTEGLLAFTLSFKPSH